MHGKHTNMHNLLRMGLDVLMNIKEKENPENVHSTDIKRQTIILKVNVISESTIFLNFFLLDS